MSAIWFLFYIYHLLSAIVDATEHCPNTCKCNRIQIWCRGNGKTNLPDNFAWDTEEIIFRDYSLPNKTLTAQHIKESNETRWLTLRKVGIERIESGIFSVLKNLEVLRISENDLKELKENIFEGLDKLWDLSLRNNQLESIDGAFLNLSTLKVLDLSWNKISQITNTTFIGIDQVSYISLDYNQISRIDAGSFDRMTSVTLLVLSSNPLSNVTFLSLPQNVVKLNLSQIGIDTIPTLPRNTFASIYQLILSYNNITEITRKDIEKLSAYYSSIQVLNFGHNQIQQIESNLFKRLFPSLLDLILSYNQLKDIPSGLPFFLRYLFLSYNQISVLQDNTLKGSSLIILSLNNNQIKDISVCSFCGLFRLRHLNLQNNKIEVLKMNVFLNLTSLFSLELSNNRIKKLEIGCFNGLEKLSRLEIAHNPEEIQYEEEVLLPLRGLKSIFISHNPTFTKSLLNPEILFKYLNGIIFMDISHNNLIKLPKNMSSYLSHLRHINLSSNKWHCSKSILWLTVWMNSPKVLFQNREKVVCSSPKELKGKRIDYLKEDDFYNETHANRVDLQSTHIDYQFEYKLHPSYQYESNSSVEMIAVYSLLPGLLIVVAILLASGPIKILKNRFKSFRKIDLNVFCEFKDDSVQTALISDDVSNNTLDRNLLDAEENFSFYSSHL
ncbi:insulin-like growth factor-binding protein complex acid labile subunit [Centruroides sculpturatus]|uniref:insulin-like growth factor-binding protein complex acid labile subunit n=1 Tax=Centruroides sculpturatus TaxID=218467 RepID=UPI000C6EF775|nr:insulin-like growth factor-binding protein complex acid labile subunit [Centruroides sculpturatus]